MNKNYWRIIVSAVLCVLLGSAGALFTAPEIQGWYQSLNKPSWNPPNWLFGPVWTLLYLLMGIAAGIIWNSNAADKKSALQVFILQFILNSAWSFLFFNRHWIGVALIEIVLLFLLLLRTIFLFQKVNRTAAYLLIPYAAWVAFAACLNAAFYVLNH